MDRLKLFEKEINYIKDDDIKESLKIMIEKLPDYFFIKPASSTGKYHPTYATGVGGLVRHTKAAIRVAMELFNNPIFASKYTKREQDLMIMGLLLHDGLKLGMPEEKYTRFDHPILMANYIKDNKNDLNLSDDDIEFLSDIIKTHMGPWTTDYNGNEVLEAPKTKYQTFVHMCDYLASRKSINFSFDNDNNIII